MGHRSTDKRYAGDNRLMTPKSPYRRRRLAPRCRLITSWGWRRSQGFGCSPIKVVRELGSERRETVRSLSAVGVGELRGSVLSTRGPGWTHLWWTWRRPTLPRLETQYHWRRHTYRPSSGWDREFCACYDHQTGEETGDCLAAGSPNISVVPGFVFTCF